MAKKTRREINNMKRDIFNRLMASTLVTSKPDIMGDDPIEDKVYTKKIAMDIDYNDGTCLESISITSDDEKFSDVSLNNVRLNFTNRGNKWVNIFLNQATDAMVCDMANKFSK